MNLDDFIKKYTGIKVGNTEANKGQCVGLVMVYINELGLSHIWGHAKDLFNNASDDEWIKIANSPDGVPLKGDVLVWGGGTYGHTAIFVDGNVNDFKSFDQNYPLGSTPHIQYHNYDNLTGWLHPKVDSCEEIQNELIEMRLSRDKWKLKCSEDAKEFEKRIKEKEEHIEIIQSTIAEQNTQIITMNETIKMSSEEKESLLGQTVTLRQELIDMTTSRDDEKARADKFEKKYNDLRSKKLWWQFWR